MAFFHCHPSLSSLGSVETQVVVVFGTVGGAGGFQRVEGLKGSDPGSVGEVHSLIRCIKVMQPPFCSTRWLVYETSCS